MEDRQRTMGKRCGRSHEQRKKIKWESIHRQIESSLTCIAWASNGTSPASLSLTRVWGTKESFLLGKFVDGWVEIYRDEQVRMEIWRTGGMSRDRLFNLCPRKHERVFVQCNLTLIPPLD